MRLRGIIFIFIICIPLLRTAAQPYLRTLVTESPIVLGEPCRVQYIMEQIGDGDSLASPAFRHFRITRGPETEWGSQAQAGGFRQLRNIHYVLTPLRTGKLRIPGAKAWIDGKWYSNEDVVVNVISPEEAVLRRQASGKTGSVNANIYLAPGEDPYQKISEGLFLKVMIDRSSCWVGQPITATFQLYSRLYSQSDIVKNPGFYGFSVLEMLGLADKKVETKNWNGHVYDVHTVKKVQLYPLYAGRFEIDPMEVKSKVSFSRSAVDAKPEQEINEGVFDREEKDRGPGWVDFDHVMRTEPVQITVRDLPAAGKPSNWAGTVGKFSISWRILEEKLAANETGHLELTLSGSGNFSQIVAPEISWPEGVEGFAPELQDKWDNSRVPVQGYRRFVYPFVVNRQGAMQLQPIIFPYFNTDSQRYASSQTQPLSFTISGTGKPSALVKATTKQGPSEPSNPSRIYLVIIVSAVLIGLVLFWRRETIREKRNQQLVVEPSPPPPQLITGEEALSQARVMLAGADNRFLSTLHQGIWQFLAERLQLSGTALNKLTLQKELSGKVPDNLQKELLGLLEECEMGIYTDAQTGSEKEELLFRANALLKKMESLLV